MTQLTLTTPTGEEQSLSVSELLSQAKYTVLYFYPKDDTPGCTLEAQWFNALLPEFQKLDVQIIWVSHDPHKSHCKFVSKYGLWFPLIADTDLIIHNDPRFNTWWEKSMYGKKYMGTMRQTFVLDVSWNVVKSRDKVDTKAHAQEVLEWARGME